MPSEPKRGETIFMAALELPITERAAFLNRECAGDPKLRGEVESLLAAHVQAGTFLDQPAAAQTTVSLSPENVLPRSEEAGDRIGRYRLLEKIGEGGFGDVWMAEQEEPVRRRVALKIIKLGMDTREVVARFEAERQALALMDHPNIARVFDGGATENGRPYFVMELVRGEPITTYCDAQRLSVDERLELFMQVCQAVQHAHQKGIIHRDLKPSNVLVSMLDDRPVPKVIDFGIAKAMAQRLTEKTLFTRFHQFIGTPAYMSPEQTGANREDIDTRSDIYALGVLLYELLTGQTPFETQQLLGAGYEAILKTIREQEPPKPSTRLTTLTKEQLGVVAAGRRTAPERLSKTVRGDLDWIVMKCLEKNRTRRYATANELALDLQRHLASEPVLAAPPSVVYRVRRFVAHHQLSVCFSAALTVTVVAGAVLSLSQAARANRQSREAALQRSVATNEAARAVAALRESEQHRERAETGELRAWRLLCAANMNLIQREWDQTRLRHLWELLEELKDFPERDFEWFWWHRQMHREQRTLRGLLAPIAVAFSPDGTQIVAADNEGTVELWEVSSGRDLRSWKEVRDIRSVAFSPNGRRMVAGTGTAQGAEPQAHVWDVSTGQELLVLKGHTGAIVSVAFSADGARVLTGSQDKTARVWDARDGSKLLSVGGYSDSGAGVMAAFSPDGRCIATTCGRHGVKFWDAETGQELLWLSESADGSFDYNMPVAFSPEGNRILTAAGPTAALWDVASGAEVVRFKGHADLILSVAFSPDGRSVATASVDQLAKIWDAASGRELRSFKGHTGPVYCLAFSPDGHRLVTGSPDMSVRIWDQTTNGEFVVLRGHTSSVETVVFSPDSQQVVTGSRDHTAKVWDVLKGRELFSFDGHAGNVTGVAFLPDGRGVVSGGPGDSIVRVWEASSGKHLQAFQPPSSSIRAGIRSLAVSPDGARIAGLTDAQTLLVWAAKDGQELLVQKLAGTFLSALTFSADGGRILVGNVNRYGTVGILDAIEGKELVMFAGHDAPVTSIAVCPGGQWVVSASRDGTAKIWEAANGQERLSLDGHSGAVWCVAVNPNGQRIATGSHDRTVKLWDANTGRELLSLSGHTGPVSCVAFSPDGRRLVSGGQDQTVRIWEAASPEQVAGWDEAEKAGRQRIEEMARAIRLERDRRVTNQPPSRARERRRQ